MEYAILFILLSILFIGGAEMGMATLASYKNTDAAKTAISTYAEVNQRRLNVLNAEKQYLIELSAYACTTIEADGSCNASGEHANYVRYLDYLESEDIGFEGTFSDLLVEANSLLAAPPAENAPSTVIANLDSNIGNHDGALTLEEALFGIEAIQNSVPPVGNLDEGKLKFRLLLLISHYALSRLPLSAGGWLSQAHIALGDHASVDIQQPSCLVGNEYDYGFPVDGVNDRYIPETGSGFAVYLFNPLPIDVASCQGADDSRGGRSRISILVGGYDDPNDPSKFEPGLPKLNQAMYGMYKHDLGGLLIPPGTMCLHEDCPNQNLIAESIGPTGYYRWNKGSDGSGVEDLFKYTIDHVDVELQQGFRPAMQIDCNIASNPRGQNTTAETFGNINDPLCQGEHSKVRLHTRYRKLFEGFLTFGLQELNVAEGELENALKLFYNPNHVGEVGSNSLVGSMDSEIGHIGRNGLPAVKKFKDFRGCYEVDVDTNQVSACN